MIEEKMFYYELIRKLTEKEINPDNYTFKMDDDSKTSYFWDEDEEDLYYKNNMGKLYIKDEYKFPEIMQKTMLVIKNDKKILTKSEKKVLKELEKLYIELDSDIDACQGCMNNLDTNFEILNVYKDLMSYLSGNSNYVEDNRDRMVEELYQRFKEQKEEEEHNKNILFEHVKSGTDLLLSKNNKDRILWNTIQKVNDILNYLKDKENKEN